MSRKLIVAAAVAVLLLVDIGAWWQVRGRSQVQLISALQKAENDIARYRQAKQNGRTAEACKLAMSITAWYSLGQDEINHAKWQKIEREDCAASAPEGSGGAGGL
jgi:hypothetical protein